MLDTCRGLLDSEISIKLPLDFTAMDSNGEIGNPEVTAGIRQCGNSIPNGWKGLDIGPGSAVEFSDLILEAGTVLWNGPMGVFEDPRFSAGTETVAQGMADTRAFTFVGGGDSAFAIKKFGFSDSGSYVFKSGDLEVKGTSSEVGSGDAGVISLISFDLGESKVEGADYSIEFKASGAHMSLVALRLDLAKEKAVVRGFKDLGIEGGEFEEWQKLTVGYGEPGNVADVAGSSQKAKLTQKTPGAMATGGGNIYNPGGVSVFEVSGSIEGVLSQITLQVWSAGSPVDSGSYVFKSGDLEVKGTSSEVGSGDAGVISLISFDLGESKVEEIGRAHV